MVRMEETMKLTYVERWTLANQYRILEALYPDEAKHHQYARTVLEEGYELHYLDLYPGLSQDEGTLSEMECDEIQEILQMYWVLQNTYQKLPNAERKGIDGDKL